MADPRVSGIDLSLLQIEPALSVLNPGAGLVLTGGPDVNPARYGKESELGRCSIDSERDDFELVLYAKSKGTQDACYCGVQRCAVGQCCRRWDPL